MFCRYIDIEFLNYNLQYCLVIVFTFIYRAGSNNLKNNYDSNS